MVSTISPPCTAAHEAHAPLALAHLAGPRAHVALHPTVGQAVPVGGRDGARREVDPYRAHQPTPRSGRVSAEGEWADSGDGDDELCIRATASEFDLEQVDVARWVDIGQPGTHAERDVWRSSRPAGGATPS